MLNMIIDRRKCQLQSNMARRLAVWSRDLERFNAFTVHAIRSENPRFSSIASQRISLELRKWNILLLSLRKFIVTRKLLIFKYDPRKMSPFTLR